MFEAGYYLMWYRVQVSVKMLHILAFFFISWIVFRHGYSEEVHLAMRRGRLVFRTRCDFSHFAFCFQDVHGRDQFTRRPPDCETSQKYDMF